MLLHQTIGISMPVKYRVQRFGPNKKKWWFRVIHNRTVTAPDMAERIKDASSLTEVDVLGAIDALSYRVRAALKEGNRVHIKGLGTFSLSAQGWVDSDEARLRPEQLDVVFRPDPALRQHVRANAELRKELSFPPAPTLLNFTDAASERHDAYTAGNIGLLEGSQLKFDPDDPARWVVWRGVLQPAGGAGSAVKICASRPVFAYSHWGRNAPNHVGSISITSVALRC